MILEFAVENFRSIKDRQVFSMIAEPSKAKGENVFEALLPNGSSIRLLKTAVIYGANASGKSNFIQALSTLIRIIRYPVQGAGKPMSDYTPFLFSKESMNKPTTFELSFIFENIKYEYKISYAESILEEQLRYFPKGKSQLIFERIEIDNPLIHKAKLGKNFGDKHIEVFANQLILSKFGFRTPNEQLTPLFNYFNSFSTNNTLSNTQSASKFQVQNISRRLSRPDQQFLFKRLEKLIKAADTKIEGLDVIQEEEEIKRFRMIVNDDTVTREPVIENITSTKINSRHNFYENGQLVGIRSLDFDKESEGTKALFWRGGLILEKLHNGGVLIFDELDNSLHPKLVKFLVKLFTNPISNPNNTQLIFATHEVTLLDRDIFRTDQIWFAEKNEFGETEMFSVQDFNNIREDIPFDKWYMAGKFGGQPNIDEIDSIFNNE